MSTYEVGEYKFPSVTTIISDSFNKSGGLLQWSANCAVEYIKENGLVDNWYDEARFAYKNISTEALDIGSQVHGHIEYYLKSGKEPRIEEEKTLSAFVAFIEFADSVNLEPITLEETVIGEAWAGTLDFYGTMNGKLYVIDFKTSKAHYMAEMGAQIAAYRSCKPEAVGSGILRLDKETGYPDWKDYSKRYESDLNVFNKCVELYYAKHPRIRKEAGKK